jgi:sugar phosphate isomerase/epimerase
MLNKKQRVKFGLMQGRLFPQKKQYNYFPSLWRKEFSLLNKTKIDYIELIYNNKNAKYNPLNYKNSYKLAYKIFSEKRKLYSLNLDYFAKKNFLKNKKNSLKILKKFFIICNNLKIKILVIPCVEKNTLNEKELLLLSKEIKKILKFNLKVSLEVNFPLSKNTIKNLDKQVGLCMDTGNLSEKKINLAEFYKNHKKVINHIHIKDKKKIGFGYSNCMLGSGIVDFKSFFKAIDLKKNNYFTLETFYGSNPINNLKLNLRFLKKYI